MVSAGAEVTEPWEWVEADLERLIKDQVRESTDLDYKASPALENTQSNKDSISKDVSAFANAGGGTIVYGVTENGHLPIQSTMASTRASRRGNGLSK
jgi:predicted HTH transcriptional regulator